MNHCTVAHYAGLHDRVTIKTPSGVCFYGETRVGSKRKRAEITGAYMPAMKICPVCGEYKRFARAMNRLCSRKCASVEMWAKRK
jgi:ribosomal protein L32